MLEYLPRVLYCMKSHVNVPVFAFIKFTVIGPINDYTMCFDNKNHCKRKKWYNRVLTHLQIKAEENQLFRFHTCLMWTSWFFPLLHPAYSVHPCTFPKSPASPGSITYISTWLANIVEDQLPSIPSNITSNTIMFCTAVQWFAKWYFKSDYSKITKPCKLL